MSGRICVVGLSLFFCLFSVQCLSAREEAKIVMPETAHDFGRIEGANGPVKHVFAVRNDGKATLELIRVSSSCRCLLAEWSKKTVEPGETARLEVTYHPVGQSGAFSHSMQVFSNGSETPLVLTVKGNVHAAPGAVVGEPEFTPDAWTHDFGKIDEEQNYYTHIFQITNTGKAPLIISHVQSSCGCAEPEWTADPIAPGEVGDVVITYSAKNRPGPFKKHITVYTNAKGGRQRLAIMGEVIPKPSELPVVYQDTIGTIQLESKTFMFHTIRPKEIATQEIWIRNFSDVSQTLSFVNMPAHIQVEAPDELAPGKAERMKVTVDGTKVTTKGRMLGGFTWMAQSAAGEVLSYEIPVSVNFIDDFSTLSPMQKTHGAGIKLSTTLLEFGRMKRGGLFGIGSKRASKQVTLTNEGKELLELHSVSCDDPRVHVTGFNRRMLGPGESVTLTLLIRPKEVTEPMETMLYVVCNDPRGPVRQVKITAK
ncbi:MAG: DUF1573 domain-containing protein [Tannerella sp.]|nr:DUF1573 domain-containing protein [Tannerella sp.]